MMCAFNPGLETEGHTFNLGHTFCWTPVNVGVGFEVFFSSFPWCDSQLTSCCLQDVGHSAVSTVSCLPAGHHAPYHDGLHL